LVLVAAFLSIRTSERLRHGVAMARLGNLLALLSTALLATESFAAKRTFAKKKGKTQMWITIVVVVGTVMLALLCALYCQCGDRIYTAGNNNRRNEQEPLIVEGKPIPPP
jgi:F0F1-type ATP synthase membrane subunit c/vacuolar-type H+-ATPase subunit K